MQNSLEQLKTSLKEMFQFQNNDLSFGIFKIYKLKQKEIENFIDKNLETIVKQELQNISNLEEKTSVLELELFLKTLNQSHLLDDINKNYNTIEGFINVGGEEETEKLKNILKSRKNGDIEGDLENKIYNYILNFFELYYSDGDFGYNTRSLNTYKVEYDEDYKGNDIMFHWKHKGSYYIKSANGFNSIKFELDPKNIEFLLETNKESDGEEVSQNNNRETDFKHYGFSRIEQTGENHFKVFFHLSKTSTSKEEIYKAIFTQILGKNLDDVFLFEKSGKPIFKSLDKDFSKIENGNIKGFSQLKIKKDDLVKKYNENVEIAKRLKKTFDELDSKNEVENTLISLWSLDNKLNSFYIGNDSDFFIHKDLGEFLTREKEKFIKNNILGDINTILNSKIDNTTLIIAKTFNEISSKIIEFLSAIEEFQKGIFESKKKVVVSEYCITLDKINESFYDEILENKEQITEWKNLGFINDEKVFGIDYLKNHQTLSIDTKFFSQNFKDTLLSTFEDLEKETNGILINSENFQALNLLKNKYRGKVKCIYIDPPYNTGNNFIYKNTFRHSSWLSMMENRILEAKDFLSKDGILIIAIDENEQENLGRLLNNIFDTEIYEITCVSVIHNPSGIQGVNFSHNHEFAFFVYNKNIKAIRDEIRDEKSADIRNFMNGSKGNTGDYLRESGKTCFYPILVKNDRIIGFGDVPKDDFHPKTPNILLDNNIIAVYPIDKDGVERKWLYARNSVESIISDLQVSYNKDGNIFIKRIKKEITVKTNWINKLYNAKEYGTSFLNNIIGSKKFDFPKSIHLVKDSIFLSTDKDSIVLDFFSGSGTTQQAVIELNKEDNGNRKYIGVEMGEYFDSVTKPRIQKVIYTSNWKDGKPQDNKGVSQIMKYQVLEQYEDILDKLETDTEKFPDGLDLKYLYKKEEIALQSTLDLRKPFSNSYIYGKEKRHTFIDLIETYNYILGNSVKNIQTFEIGSKKKYYKCIKTGNTLQVWRNIEVGENDIENIKEIVAKYNDIEVLEVNVEVYSLERNKFGMLEINGKDYDIQIIDESVFSE